MPHHYSKRTIEASYYCKVCNRKTMHRIDDGRLGPCLADTHRTAEPPAQTAIQATHTEQQLDLFSQVIKFEIEKKLAVACAPSATTPGTPWPTGGNTSLGLGPATCEKIHRCSDFAACLIFTTVGHMTQLVKCFTTAVIFLHVIELTVVQ